MLFVPAQPTDPVVADLVAVFLAAPDGLAVEAVTEFAEAREFDVAAFVVVGWSDGVRVALFGDVELTSDHRSLPRLSAAGSGTWIERPVRAERVVLGVGVEHVDAITDLVAGVVTAGGFAIELTSDPSSPIPRPPVGSAPVRAVEPPDRFSRHVVEPDPDPHPEPPDDASDALRTPPRSELADRLARSMIDEDREAASLADLVGRTGDASDITVDVPDDLLAGLDLDGGLSASAGKAWRIRFADGAAEPVDANLLLGRKPTIEGIEPPARAVVVDCPQVSARHLTLRVDGRGQLIATDLRSHNHSWIVTTGDHRLVQLEPEVPTPLDDGTHVQIGSRVFVVERVDS